MNKNIFTKLASHILNLFKDARKRIKQAVQLTQWLKEAIDSGVVTALVAFIPGGVAFRDKMAKRLAEVLHYLGLIENVTFLQKKTFNAISGPDRKKWLTAIAGELASRDLNIDYDSAVAQTQLIYETDPAFKTLAA